MIKRYNSTQAARKARVRSKIFGTAERPRLSVFRSGKHIYAQIINDEAGVTLASASDATTDTKAKMTKSEKAAAVGASIAQAAKKQKIQKVRFDRGHYKFLGRVKALAEAAREQGLEF